MGLLIRNFLTHARFCVWSCVLPSLTSVYLDACELKGVGGGRWFINYNFINYVFLFFYYYNSFAVKIYCHSGRLIAINYHLIPVTRLICSYLLTVECHGSWWGDKKSMISFLICLTTGFFSKVQTAKLALRRLKTLRHPNILRYIDALEVRIKEMLPLMVLLTVSLFSML